MNVKSILADNFQRRDLILCICLFAVAILLSCAAPARAREKVTLQLKWRHQFQFAGYYAAKAKGYYRAAGLEVNFLEARPEKAVIDSVLEGTAQYGVFDSRLLLARKEGKPVVALGVIFQHSPAILIARQESPTQNIHDLAGKRIMLEKNTVDIAAYLLSEGLTRDRFTSVSHSYNLQDFIDGKVDAISAYLTNEPFFLDRIGFRYLAYSPRSAGIDFYGDALFTTEAEIKNHPARVKAFREASIRGWKYAMAHPEEIVELILAEYSQGKIREHLLFEAHQMAQLIQPELVEMGYMNPGRWRHIAETYADLGLLPGDFSLDGFLYDPEPKSDHTYIVILALVLALGLAIALGIVLLLRKMVRVRTEDLNNANRVLAEQGNLLKASNDRFENLVANTPGHIAYVNADTLHYEFVNDQFEKSFGIPRGEIIGSHIKEIIGEENYQHALKYIDVVRQGKPISYENTFNLVSGKRWIRVNYSPIFGEEGKVTSIVVLSYDITERKQAEEMLWNEKAFLRSLIDSAEDLIYFKDQNSIYLGCNKASEKFTGMAEAEQIGKSDFDFFDREFAEQVVKNDQMVLAGGSSIRVEEWVPTPISGRRLLETVKAPIYGSEGQPIGLVGISRDVTDRKSVEREKLELEQQLQQVRKLESLGVLAGGIAHDFNNILAGVYGNVSLARAKLAKDHPEHPAFRYLAAAEESMNRATLLSGQLLTFAKGGDPVKENLSLGDLIEDVVNFNLSGSKVKPVIVLADNLWLAKADQGQIQQVFSNLSINAKQAMPDGGHLYIEVENAEIPMNTVPDLDGGKYLQITVTDEGIGIAPEHLDRVFDPYFTTKQTGSGLGLATIYSIIARHSGHISVASRLGKGTTFTLYLPASETGELSRKQPDLAPAVQGPPAKVLVMDDEEVIRTTVTAMLEELSFTVETVTDGQQAVQFFQQALADGEPYDLVILDLTIPGGLGGKEAAPMILQLDPQASLVVSSGYADDPIMANFTEFGFKGVVSKPYNLNKLSAVLSQVLRD